MNLTVRESNRWCVVERDKRPSPTKLRRQILREENVVSGFSILEAPAPAHDDTIFKVCGNEKEILVAVALMDSTRHLSARPEDSQRDTVEILFDPLSDQLGYVQFLFAPSAKVVSAATDPHRDPESTDDVQVISHLPYPEAHSSGYPILKLRNYQWRDEDFSTCPIMLLRCRWLFAWFPTQEVFRNGDVCGLNICRERPHLAEFSSWNYCSGNGAQDATSFGQLYRSRAPAHVACERAALDGNVLHATGRVGGDVKALAFELASPDGERVRAKASVRGDTWEARAKIDARVGGRYRLYPVCDGKAIEPRYLAIDVPARRNARTFCLSVTYDSPMSIVANYYTPDRLDRDMAIWADLGITRIHWIEYGDWPSFWHHGGGRWSKNYRKTIEHCDDYLAAAVGAAHAHDLEFIADLKTFDLGINCFFEEPDGVSTVEDLEGKHVSVIPEIAAHQEWTMRSNPAWQVDPSFPVARLRLYSETPIPGLRPEDVRLLTSKDNVRYRRYGKPFGFTQGALRRPHRRWTPAGNVRERGSCKNWYVELCDLDLQQPFLAVRLGKEEIRLTHRGCMLAEAWDGHGRAVPLTVATNGDSADGFFFWKGWPGWTNQTEAILQRRAWAGRNLGFVFREMPNMPTMLEPAYEGARTIWLGRITTMLTSGVDGVDIRTYCHHNGPMSYLKYAFAPPVCETFRSMYGREPRAEPDDYERVRRIRGDCYTDFLREAKKLVAGHGKKLIIELESGIEMSPALDCRMQLPMDWQTWLREGVMDEIRLKWWTMESPFIHENVLPLARKHGVPVHITSRCLHQGLGARATELADLVIGGACAAGFAGYSFYEQQNLMDLNPEGQPTLKGPVRQYFEKAREALAAIAAGGAL